MPDKGEIVGEPEWLFRRSYPQKQYVNPDGTATSRVFKLRVKDAGQLSVDVKSLTTPEKSIVDKTLWALFEISHENVKACGVHATHDPIDTNEAHAFISGQTFTVEDDIIPGLLARKSARVLVA